MNFTHSQASLRGRDGKKQSVVANNAGVVISSEHARIHAGSFYSVSHVFQSVANNAYVRLLTLLDASIEAHAVWSIWSEGDALVFISENPVVTNNGTEIAVRNRKRTAPDNPDSAFCFHSPTVSSEGLVLFTGQNFGGRGGNAFGAETFSEGEWVLNHGNSYLLSAQNVSGQSRNIAVILSFYLV